MNMRKRNSIANYARKTIILLLILSLLPCNLLHASAFTVNNGIMKSSYKFNPYVEDNIDMKDSYKVEFAIESEWENHYNGKITIKNISDQDIKNWTLSFVSKDTIENIWSAEIEKHDNDTYIIKNSGWNQDIKAGQEISFGFTASYKQEADTPHDFLMQNLCLDNTDKEETVTNNSYEVKFVIESEWENHYNGKINKKNISDKDIKNWTLSFISKDIIENIWSAKIEKHDNDTYLVKNLGWNQDIKAGQEISFGFTASYKQEANTPHNFLIPNLYKDDVTENDNNLDDLDESDELDDFFEAELTIESEWENHYNGKITVKNISDKDIENWKLSFISKDTIENIWSAKIDAHDSDTYIVKNLGWNQDIKAGQEISFGFTASYKQEADAPHDFYMSSICKKVEATHMIDYKIVSNWGTGLNGEITVKNTSNKVIEDWRLIFESNLDIERFWTAEVDGKEGNIYFVKNLGYNANIAPGETLTLGFSAKGTEGKILMKEFTLYYMDVYTEDTTDTDGDGLYDTYEKTLGTNPEKKDSDSDGLDDYFEVYTLATDPLKADSDGNGVQMQRKTMTRMV